MYLKNQWCQIFRNRGSTYQYKYMHVLYTYHTYVHIRNSTTTI
mgnify:CR=1 FL=1